MAGSYSREGGRCGQVSPCKISGCAPVAAFPGSGIPAAVVQALFISYLGNCNVLSMGLPLKSIQRLQLVQIVVPEAVFGAPRVAHVTLLFCELHWLLACFQVQLKILVITFKGLHAMGPGDLRNCLSLWDRHTQLMPAEGACCGPHWPEDSGEEPSVPWHWPFGTSCPLG